VKNAAVLSANPRIFSAGTSSSNTTEITILSSNEGNELRVLGDVGGVRKLNWTTAAKFRDPSAWFHLVVALDTTQGTAANRLKVYMNGVQLTTAGAASTLPSQDDTFEVNNTSTHYIGRSGPYNEYLSGYLADIHFIDGQALDPTSFGEFDDNGIWQPIEYTGTYAASPNYSSLATISAGGAASGFELSKGFDFDLANRFEGDTTGAYVDIPYSANVTSGSVEVLVGVTGSQPLVVTLFNGGTQVGSGSSGTTGLVWHAPTTYAGPITSIRISRTGRAPEFNAIRVNGQILYDTYGQNSFHLDFSDNSTAAALGTDSAGSNDWTVNNISTLDYVSYNSTVSTTATEIGSPYVVGNLFDGNVGPSGTAYWLFQDLNKTLTINLTGKSAASSVGIYMRLGGPSNSTTVSVTATIGGVAYTQTFNNTSTQDQLITFTQTGAITTIVATLTKVNSNYGWGATGVSIDGTYLVNSSGAGNDSLVDVPTNGTETDTGIGGQVRGNYCTFNPLVSTSASISNGNLDASNSNSITQVVSPTIVPTVKCYWEITINAILSGGIGGVYGVNAQGARPDQAGGAGIYLAPAGSSGGTYVNGVKNAADYTASIGDVIGLAFDPSTRELIIYRNGSLVGTLTAPATASLQPVSALNLSVGVSANFGQRPFAFTSPAGYKALCTANLPAPVVTKPSTVMDVKLYTGNGSTQTISGLEFSPDLAWFKARNQAYSHSLYDIVRGALIRLKTNSTDQEASDSGSLTAFNSDGFTLGGSTSTNANNEPYVAWTWDAGSSTVTDNTGSIQSTRRTNASAGLSIVTWTGNGTYPSTVGHGLGVAPHMIILKIRNQVRNWFVYHKAAGTGALEGLNTTSAYSSYSPIPGGDITSTTFKVVDSNSNANSDTLVAYCFAPVSGYSAMGSYVGNGSSDGPFVFTGFRSRFILIKGSSFSVSWVILDTARNTYNIVDQVGLRPNVSDADSTDPVVDIVSNGFKMRKGTASLFNNSGATYVWAAFAENPFALNARAR
jgi:hypothetical protein